MAHIDMIMFQSYNRKDGTMRVTVKMQPSGEAAIDVALPLDFFNCIMKIAQLAADLHEQQMRAKILADGAKP